MRNFRNYEIYQEAMDIATLVYKKTKTFPKHEVFSLTNQLNRAVVSIASNIAEGASRESEKEFSHFLEIAIGSAFEVETQLTIAKNLGYLKEEEIEPILAKLGKVERQLNQLIIMLNNKKVEVGPSKSQGQSQGQSIKL
jgi:four helix bundle protein